jgi:hypothetical protein
MYPTVCCPHHTESYLNFAFLHDAILGFTKYYLNHLKTKSSLQLLYMKINWHLTEETEEQWIFVVQGNNICLLPETYEGVLISS